MTLVFYPEKTTFIEASAPHPPNTQYRISAGVENWDGVFIPVYKIQMVYDGKVSGRKCPSYPVDSEDFAKVHTELNNLIERVKKEVEIKSEVGVN